MKSRDSGREIGACTGLIVIFHSPVHVPGIERIY